MLSCLTGAEAGFRMCYIATRQSSERKKYGPTDTTSFRHVSQDDSPRCTVCSHRHECRGISSRHTCRHLETGHGPMGENQGERQRHVSNHGQRSQEMGPGRLEQGARVRLRGRCHERAAHKRHPRRPATGACGAHGQQAAVLRPGQYQVESAERSCELCAGTKPLCHSRLLLCDRRQPLQRRGYCQVERKPGQRQGDQHRHRARVS